ncbi:unnamed protein product [Effrenium voratum]|nr:unnamed protein product [Effrenium voratum]CAJ1419620.1 unnamed protein product [Effrenium voratum]
MAWPKDMLGPDLDGRSWPEIERARLCAKSCVDFKSGSFRLTSDIWKKQPPILRQTWHGCSWTCTESPSPKSDSDLSVGAPPRVRPGEELRHSFYSDVKEEAILCRNVREVMQPEKLNAKRGMTMRMAAMAHAPAILLGEEEDFTQTWTEKTSAPAASLEKSSRVKIRSLVTSTCQTVVKASWEAPAPPPEPLVFSGPRPGHRSALQLLQDFKAASASPRKPKAAPKRRSKKSRAPEMFIEHHHIHQHRHRHHQVVTSEEEALQRARCAGAPFHDLSASRGRGRPPRTEEPSLQSSVSLPVLNQRPRHGTQVLRSSSVGPSVRLPLIAPKGP